VAEENKDNIDDDKFVGDSDALVLIPEPEEEK